MASTLGLALLSNAWLLSNERPRMPCRIENRSYLLDQSKTTRRGRPVNLYTCSIPTFWDVTMSASLSSRRCCETAGCVIANAAVSVFTEQSDSESKEMIFRRAGCAMALNTAFVELMSIHYIRKCLYAIEVIATEASKCKHRVLGGRLTMPVDVAGCPMSCEACSATSFIRGTRIWESLPFTRSLSKQHRFVNAGQSSRVITGEMWPNSAQSTRS